MTRAKRPIVAIDGPAGAGKSTVSKRVADALGYLLLDTGAIYRSVAWVALREGQKLDDADAVSALAQGLADSRAISVLLGPSGPKMIVRGEDVSSEIRTPEVGLAASRVSAHPGVRRALLAMQRSEGEKGGVVLEGRDIGTVVFPDAEAKFFLTARPDIRAQRRQRELAEKGIMQPFEQTLREVVERDRMDETREVAPLRRAPDAIVVDASDRGIDEVVAEIVVHVRRLVP